MSSSSRARRTKQNAFTLLEVILAIAILAISLGYIGASISQGFSNANGAASGLEARIVAQTIIDQLKCGSMEIIDAGPIQLDETEALGEWSVQIIVEPTPKAIAGENVVQVRVLVGRSTDTNERPACELVRWLQHPDYAEQMAAMVATAESAAAAAASDTSSDSSSSF